LIDKVAVGQVALVQQMTNYVKASLVSVFDPGATGLHVDNTQLL